MKLKILTPGKLVLEKEVDSVTMPGKAGQFTVLSGHDLMAAELQAGRLFIRWTDAERKPMRGDYDVGEGFAEITREGAAVFVSSAKGAKD